MNQQQPIRNHILDDPETNLTMPSSFNLKNEMNTASMEQTRQKTDASTSTDHLICKCDCNQIQKLKEKAHKSFMQVIQIQNLYKEQIEQVQEQYEEREKTQLKKFQYKEQMLNQKCKQLEQELEKNREYLEKDREQTMCKCQAIQNHMLEFSLESPFVVDNVEEIYPEIKGHNAVNPDDSIDTIRNLKQFIPSENLEGQQKMLIENLHCFMQELKTLCSETQEKSKATLIIQRAQNSIKQVMNLLSLLIENVVSSQQKYNSLCSVWRQTQNRHNKLLNAFEAAQKQSKFMADHIRRISQDKIKLDRKYHEVQKTNQQLQQIVNDFRKKGLDLEGNRLDNQSNLNIRQSNDDDDISVSLGSYKQVSLGHKKSGTTNEVFSRMNALNSKNVNFKKKPNLLQKKSGH